jgi:hypothetical protein
MADRSFLGMMLRAGLGPARRACSASICPVGGVLTGTALAGAGKPGGVVFGGHPAGALDGA